jgi:hypothetical protein
MEAYDWVEGTVVYFGRLYSDLSLGDGLLLLVQHSSCNIEAMSSVGTSACHLHRAENLPAG